MTNVTGVANELRVDPVLARRVVTWNVRYSWIFAAFIAITQGGLNLIAGRPEFALLFLTLAVLMVVATSLLARRMVNNTRIVFGDGTYVVHGLGASKTFTVADVTRVATIASMGNGVAGTTPHLIVAGRSKPLMHLVGQLWTVEQMSTLANDLTSRGALTTPIPSITPVALRAFDPRLISAWRARPLLTGLLAGLAALVFAIVVIVVVLAFVLPPIFGY